MKEMFTPSKMDVFVAVAPHAYQHSRAARVALRMFYFLPGSIVGGMVLPMFLFKFDDWSVWLFLPFMIGVPVLTFMILGEHPEDRAIREAQAAAQAMALGKAQGVRQGRSAPRSMEEMVQGIADQEGISYNEALASTRDSFNGTNAALRARPVLNDADVRLRNLVQMIADQLNRLPERPEVPREPRRQASREEPRPQAPNPLSKNQQRKLKRRLGLQHQLLDDGKRRKP